MSDDLEVTEHDEEIQEPEGDDFSDAFENAAGDSEEQKNENSDESEPVDQDTDDDEPEEETKGNDKADLTDEEKAAEERGKQLLEEDEKKKQKEQEDQEEAEKQKAEEDAAKEREPKPINDDQVKNFAGMFSDTDVPEKVEINGLEYNIKEYIDEFPEAKVVSGIMTQRILERLVENGVLITAKDHNSQVEDLENRLYGLGFDMTVLNQIPDAFSIVESSGYQAWLEKEATKKDIALLGSQDPKDYVLGLKRYINTTKRASEEAEKKAKEEAKKKKEKHVDIHKETGSVKRGSGLKDVEGGRNEFADSFNEAVGKVGK